MENVVVSFKKAMLVCVYVALIFSFLGLIRTGNKRLGSNVAKTETIEAKDSVTDSREI